MFKSSDPREGEGKQVEVKASKSIRNYSARLAAAARLDGTCFEA